MTPTATPEIAQLKVAHRATWAAGMEALPEPAARSSTSSPGFSSAAASEAQPTGIT